ncbi:serine O-acetyltransferase [Endozoicomonas arenosclerae]|uniref:serine O-acetyltransferase n=1 Tax=Endozoicomonas arenosclerae TaxID=1633495 RepID=UPI000784FBA8|nr:hypothetical protein [Endozoicomonas arenosclerae]
MTNWKALRLLVRSDMDRLNEMLDQPPKMNFFRKLSLLSSPGVLALYFYRVSHFHFMRDRYTLARFFYRLNLFITGADIHPRSQIGASCLLVHSIGFICDGQIGRNATIFGHCIVQPDFKDNTWSTAPIIGDNCTLGLQTSVLGAVSIASNVTLAPFTLARESIREESVTAAPNQNDGFKLVKVRGVKA